MGGSQQIAGRRQHDEQVITPEHEPRQVAAPQSRRRCALNDIETGADQRVAAKGNDHRRSVQGTQPAKVQKPLRPFKIQRRKGQLERDDHADQKAGDAPKGGRHNAVAYHAIQILILPDRRARFVGKAQNPQKRPRRHQHDDQGMHHIGRIAGKIRRKRRQRRDNAQSSKFEIVRYAAFLCLAAFSNGPITRVHRRFSQVARRPALIQIKTLAAMASAGQRPNDDFGA